MHYSDTVTYWIAGIRDAARRLEIAGVRTITRANLQWFVRVPPSHDARLTARAIDAAWAAVGELPIGIRDYGRTYYVQQDPRVPDRVYRCADFAVTTRQRFARVTRLARRQGGRVTCDAGTLIYRHRDRIVTIELHDFDLS